MENKNKEIVIEPLTRIEGHMGIRLILDVTKRKPVPGSVRCYSTMFRGIEIILRGRRVEDSIHIASRTCGVCGASHAMASAQAADMALGTLPKPLGVMLRNMAYGMADHIYDHSLILNMLGGPDYSGKIVRRFTPAVYREACKTLAPNRDVHGMEKISDIMDALDPIQGRLWKLTVKYQRIAREAAVMIWGRHSHPATLIPGGIMTDLSSIESLLTGFTYRLIAITAWAKYVHSVWEDLIWFFRNIANYEGQGKTCLDENCTEYPLFYSSGLFDDPVEYAYAGETPEEIYASLPRVTSKRIVKPGLAAQGSSVTLLDASPIDYNVGVMEKVDHSFYDEWNSVLVEEDPLGNKLLWGKENPKWHPWNKMTLPKPSEKDWSGKYSWTATVRLLMKDGKITPVELGPVARLCISSLQSFSVESQSTSVRGGGGVLRVDLPATRSVSDLPQGVWESMELEYRAPACSTTLERVWARAFNIAVDAASVWINLEKLIEYLRKGIAIVTSTWTLGKYPKDATLGWGTLEAPRGAVNHWLVQKNGKVLNYQIHSPTTINMSPSDSTGLSPFDASIANTVVTEEGSPEEWVGLDFVRAIRSFDPCVSCSAHMQIISENKKLAVLKKVIYPAPEA